MGVWNAIECWFLPRLVLRERERERARYIYIYIFVLSYIYNISYIGPNTYLLKQISIWCREYEGRSCIIVKVTEHLISNTPTSLFKQDVRDHMFCNWL